MSKLIFYAKIILRAELELTKPERLTLALRDEDKLLQQN